MPVFEYFCPNCKRRYSALVGMTAEPDDESCPHCGEKDARRLVSRFARYRTEDDRIDAMADEIEMMGEPESPAEMRRMVREMGSAMDDDMADEMEEMLEADLEGTASDED